MAFHGFFAFGEVLGDCFDGEAAPRRIMVIFYHFYPRGLGGKTCQCVQILHQFWLLFELVDIVDSFDGRWTSGKNSVGGLFMSTVSVLLFRRIATSGIRYRFAFLSNHPLNIAALDTFNIVFCAS